MSLPWYKHNAQHFLNGVATLTLEERGAYITILDLIYLRGGPIPDDAGWLSGQMMISKRAWSKLRASLIVKGKLFALDFNGQPCLTNKRASAELANSTEKTPEKTGENSEFPEIQPKKTGEIEAATKENNGLATSVGRGSAQKANPLDRDGEREQISDANASSVVGADDVAEAVALWNEMAGRAGLAKAKTLDKTRRTGIKARLREGGLETWREALAAVERSPHCRGENDRAWKADLDFVFQPKSWRRLLEGFYGGTDPSSPTTPLFVFPGPADVRTAVVAECGEDFCRCYLDPCEWRESPRALIPRTRFAADKLRREAGAVLGDVQIEERAA